MLEPGRQLRRLGIQGLVLQTHLIKTQTACSIIIWISRIILPVVAPTFPGTWVQSLKSFKDSRIVVRQIPLDVKVLNIYHRTFSAKAIVGATHSSARKSKQKQENHYPRHIHGYLLPS